MPRKLVKASFAHETYASVFFRFLKFGFLAWGGPVAQIDMIRHELVQKEGWISSKKFNRIFAVYQPLPGPEATELAIYFGHLAGGFWGGLLAGLGFVLPGFFLMLLLSWLYVSFGLSRPVRLLQPCFSASNPRWPP